ncbi:hypothetical protein WJX84_009372 [Apatococcus fuscideae]
MQTCHLHAASGCFCSSDACSQTVPGPTAANLTRKLLKALYARKQTSHLFRKSPRRTSTERCASGCFAFAAKRTGSQDPFRGDRRNSMLKFVQDVQPIIVEQFAEHTPAQVVEAMRQTVTNITGMLPPKYFSVKICSTNEDLAQLMYTAMMTGYMFRNAQYRLELRTSISGSLLEDMGMDAPVKELPEDDLDQKSTITALQEIFTTASGYAPGSQKHKAEGTVLRWHKEYGTEEIPVQQYIESLEHEVSLLRRELQNSTYLKMSQNQLLDYMKCLEQQSLNELTASQDEDTAEAMNSFVHRLLGSGDDGAAEGLGECTSQELSKLLVWLLVVGYQLRVLEVRLDLEATMLVSSMDE